MSSLELRIAGSMKKIIFIKIENKHILNSPIG